MPSAWYASLTGNSANPGTLLNPWDLQTALTGGFPSNSVQPGDTLWIRGGTFNKTDSSWQPSLVGTLGNEIIVRNYRGDDPLNQERVIIQQTNTAAAPTAGATTVNGVNGSGSATVSVAKATNTQAVAKGHQLTIASGPAAGVYVITAATTLIVGNTTVSITPNLRGATAGGETITLTLTPSGIDNINVGACSFVKFWGIEGNVILPLRTFEGGSSNNFEWFGPSVDGLHLIHCIMHDGAGNLFVDYQSNAFECYGSLFYNAGDCDPNIGDGGGHQTYVHHQGITKRAVFERNVYFNDHGVAVQFYSPAGVRDFQEGIDFLYNVVFNYGTLNNLANTGGKDGTGLEMGGAAETMNSVTVDHNYFYVPTGYGDRTIELGFTSTGRLGANIRVTNNYGHGGGSGYGCLHYNGTLAAGGSVTVTDNAFVVQSAGASWNGNAARFADALPAPAGWTVARNTFYRVSGTGEPPISAFVTSAHPFGTIAQWLTDTGFSTDTSPAVNPVVTLVVTIPTTKYESGRGWVIYYNYASLNQIPFSPADFGINVGDTFMVHDVRDVWAGVGGIAGSPVLGPMVYVGGTVNLPTTQVADPVQTGSHWGIGNETTPPATAPQFNAFLVRRTEVAAQQGGGGAASTPSLLSANVVLENSGGQGANTQAVVTVGGYPVLIPIKVCTSFGAFRAYVTQNLRVNMSTSEQALWQIIMAKGGVTMGN